jgi:hypothetical protein
MRTAMPRPVGKHESAIPCSPPTDPTGFIYPTYRAAPTETLTDKQSLNSSHPGVAYVSSSVGGSVSTLSFEDTTTKNRLSSHRRCSGGNRDRVRGFSRASRRNLLRHLASINRGAFRAFKGRIIFVTLTYPDEYPKHPELCKRHLKPFASAFRGSSSPSPLSGGWAYRREGRGTSTCYCSWDRLLDR